jgi:hypothetical protein
MSDKVDYIQDKVDSISESVHNIDTSLALTRQTLEVHTQHDEIRDEQIFSQLKVMSDTLQVNTSSLIEHMDQTATLKAFVKKIDERLVPFEIAKIQKEAVFKFKKERRMKVAKALGILVGIVTAIAALWPILQR